MFLRGDGMEGTSSANLADVGTRFLALLIDSFILSLIGGILFRLSGGAGGAAGVILGVAYQWYFLTQNRGQTPGKMLLSIRVVKIDGSQLTGADAVIRYFGYLLNSVVLSIGWLWALFDPNRQGWHDKLAKTYVIKA
jgi:uncharacterized RDD family membrane protein YckC